MKDLKDSAMPTFVAVFMDEDYFCIGKEILDHTIAEDFKDEALFRFHYIFGGNRFVLLTNHTNGDATPTEADRVLIQRIQMKTNLLGKIDLFDYIIVAGDQYWSMSGQNGTACHCGKQDYL